MPYTHSMRLAVVAGLALTAASVAHAADLGPLPPEPTMVESWTGFYVGGGGIGFLSTDVSSSSSRTDDIGFCKVEDGKKKCERDNEHKFKPFASLLQSQSSTADLGDEGFFGTVQLGYDKQLGQRWLIGAFVDADWYSDLEADSHQSSSSALNIDLGHLLKLDLPLSNITTDTSIGMDWSISVGGRFGFLATPGTLLTCLVLTPTPS